MRDTTLRVDRIRCDGSGFCAEIVPELIALDDWGYPIIHPRPVPAHLLPLARRAVASCPLQALRLAAASEGRATESASPLRPAAGG